MFQKTKLCFAWLKYKKNVFYIKKVMEFPNQEIFFLNKQVEEVSL